MNTLLLAAVLLAADAPRVAETVPAHGDAFVDPGLTEIVVVFDRDMSMRGYSFVGGGDPFPEIAGKPRWETARRCVLPVRLKPGWMYQLSLNKGRFTNFRGADGTPSVPQPLWFRTAGDDDDERRLTEADNKVAVAQLRVAMKTRYSYRDRLGVDWDALIDEREDELVAAEAPLTFAVRLAPMLAAAEDLHLAVRVGDLRLGTHGRSVAPNENMDWLLPRLRDTKRHARQVFSGFFEDGTGYLAVATWSREQEALVAEAYARVASAPALVIDVRQNSGGVETSARALAGRFITKPTVYAKHVTVAPHEPGGFSAVRERRFFPMDGPAYAGPVAVLTGPVCMSSNEAFLLMMKQAPRCTLVGARSWGSSGNPQSVALPNRVTLVLPSWQAMRPDGTVFEGEGIAPDVEVAGSFDESDPVVVRALQVLAEKAAR